MYHIQPRYIWSVNWETRISHPLAGIISCSEDLPCPWFDQQYFASSCKLESVVPYPAHSVNIISLETHADTIHSHGITSSFDGMLNLYC